VILEDKGEFWIALSKEVNASTKERNFFLRSNILSWDHGLFSVMHGLQNQLGVKGVLNPNF